VSLTDVSVKYACFILRIFANYAAQGKTLKEEENIGVLTRLYIAIACTA